MEQNGDIYLDKYAGWYSVRDEAYYAEDETHVNEHKVRLSTKSGTPVEWVEEESYFSGCPPTRTNCSSFTSARTTSCRRNG